MQRRAVLFRSHFEELLMGIGHMLAMELYLLPLGKRTTINQYQTLCYLCHTMPATFAYLMQLRLGVTQLQGTTPSTSMAE